MGTILIREMLLEKRRQRQQQPKKISNSSSLDFSEVAFIRLVVHLFLDGYQKNSRRPHPIGIPVLAHALDLLASARIGEIQDCARWLVLCQLLVDHWADSGKEGEQDGPVDRYLPEVVSHLLGTLQLCVAEEEPEQHSFSEPHPRFPSPHQQMLIPRSDNDGNNSNDDIEKSSADPLERQRRRSAILDLLPQLFQTIRTCADRYSRTCPTAFPAIFRPFLALCERLPMGTAYPDWLAADARALQLHLGELLERNACVTQMKRKIRPVMVAEEEDQRDSENPEQQEEMVVDQSSGRGGVQAVGRLSKKMNEKQRQLIQARALRKETRGAVRELRRDSRFLASIQREQLDRVREERNMKTRRIMQSLEGQESEYKKNQAKNKRKKF